MGRRKQAQPTVAPVESTVTPVQTINPEGHTGNKWVPRGSLPAQPTQAPGQTPAQAPGQASADGVALSAAGVAPGQQRGGLFSRRMGVPPPRGMGVPNTGGGYAQSKQNWLKQRQQLQRPGGMGVAPGQPGGGVTRLATPTTGLVSKPAKGFTRIEDNLGSTGWGN